MAALWGFMRFSRRGQFMVAVADNPALAEFYGIDRQRVFTLTMLIAGALVAIGMFLYGTRAQVQPLTGLELMLFATLATIIGGIGNVWGAALAAIVLGVVQNASILVIPSEWQGFLLYVFLFATIIFFAAGHSPAGTTQKARARRCPEPRRRPTSPHRSGERATMDYIYSVIILISLFVVLATSFNLVIGYGGSDFDRASNFLWARRLHLGAAGA